MHFAQAKTHVHFFITPTKKLAMRKAKYSTIWNSLPFSIVQDMHSFFCKTYVETQRDSTNCSNQNNGDNVTWHASMYNNMFLCIQDAMWAKMLSNLAFMPVRWSNTWSNSIKWLYLLKWQHRYKYTRRAHQLKQSFLMKFGSVSDKKVKCGKARCRQTKV